MNGNPSAKHRLYYYVTIAICLFWIVVTLFGFYMRANKDIYKKYTIAKVPPITYEHTSDYIGHVSDCEMFKVNINETNGNNEVKVNSFIMAKCPNSATSIMQ
jgi:hypothetical protein